MTELERSHTELRAMLILAGRRIRMQNVGRRNQPLLDKIREVLRDAQRVKRDTYSIRKELPK